MKIITAAALAAVLPCFMPNNQLEAGPATCEGCRVTMKTLLPQPKANIEIQLQPPVGSTELNHGSCKENASNGCEKDTECNLTFMMTFKLINSPDLTGRLVDENGNQLGTARQFPAHSNNVGGDADFLLQTVHKDAPCSGETGPRVKVIFTTTEGYNQVEWAKYLIYCSECQKVQPTGN